MRFLPFLLTAIITIALTWALNRKWGEIPPLGKFLSPQQGFWQNAEPHDAGFNDELVFNNLKGKVNIYYDERLVPHIFADFDEDAYFAQGYLHAKFRLWQMEFQTIAASGRVSEILGDDPRFLRYDREQRRMGMVYAAEKAWREMEANPITKIGCDAYTAGVNAYINSLTESSLPLEYKLLDYKPELWSNMKTALFLKQMSKTLAGYDTDLESTNSKSIFPFDELMKLDPQVHDSLIPIVPKGTVFDTPAIVPIKPVTADSLYFEKKDTVPTLQITKPDPLNGSNNWVVNGTKTRSGSPILCNDPHLELSFPSIWYEMQISTPNFNSYGATFPGSPNVIIGFTDSIAFGFTNSQRDVKDYYEIRFKDDSKQEYWFNNQWKKVDSLCIEEIKVKGGKSFFDTVAYTIFGPVMYDKSFSSELSNNKAIALRWTAHESSNEGLMWFYLNRATSYDDYLNAIKDFTCPGQNMIFASRRGDIAIWQQAKFPARWEGQGVYVMPGFDSSYMWQGFIPQAENPHVLNPASGYIQSANQRAVDSTYPYFIPGNYITPRGVAIDERLSSLQQITPNDMMNLQNDYYSVMAREMRGVLLKYIRESDVTHDNRKYLDMFKSWYNYATPDAVGATVYQLWVDSLEAIVWKDEFDRLETPLPWPDEQTLLEAINRDSTYSYIDNISTSQQENIFDQVTLAFQKATIELAKLEKENKLQWSKFKDPHIYHLLKTLKPFARAINVGGWSNTINATTHSHGPSWRMIVHLSSPIEAYGVYPGGQSGNPGSIYYDSFVDMWEQGKYYTLWFMKSDEALDKRVKWRVTMSNGS